MSSPSSRWQEPWLQVAVRGSGDGQLPAAVGLASCQGALSTLAEQVVGSAHQGPQAERHECEACVRAEWRHGHSAAAALLAWPWSGLTCQEAAGPQAPLSNDMAGVEPRPRQAV